MFNFFVDASARQGDGFSITGGDYNHICNVLRMQPGDTFLVSCNGESCLCSLQDIGPDSLFARIEEEHYQNTELPVEFYLFQGLPKGDKLELIIQKTVELGVAGIIPVEMSRCVMKLDEFIAAISPLDGDFLFTGDGVITYQAKIEAALGDRAHFAPAHCAYLRPAAVACAAAAHADEAVDYLTLQPMYLRAPSAERQKNLVEKAHV